VRPYRVFPLRIPREGWLLPLPALLVGAALLVSSAPGDEAFARSPKLGEALQAQSVRIADYVATEKGSKESTPGAERILGELERLAAELTRQRIGKKDALEELSKLTRELEEEEDEAARAHRDLEKRVKNFQTNEMNQDLARDLNNGDYQDAANRVKKVLEEKREQLKKLKLAKEKDLEELRKLEDEIKELEDVEAKLLRLMAIRLDMNMMGRVLDFLQDVEGDLAELEDPELLDPKDLGPFQPGQGNPNPGQVQRLERKLLPPPKASEDAGSGHVDEFQDEKEKRTANEREEQNIRIREEKGQSAFSQVQVADDGSRSQVGEKEAHQSGRKAAEETIQRQDVPAGYREYLRRYYDGIQPEEKKR